MTRLLLVRSALCVALAAFLAGAVTPFPALAEDDQIREEMTLQMKRYDDGDIPGAIDSARLIEAWLLELQAAGLSGVFGEVPGWTMTPGDAQAIAPAMMGGGITASASYEKDGQRMEAQIVANSPMLGMLTGMLGNSFMAMSAGNKIIKVDGRKAILEEQGEEWKLSLPYENAVLFTAEGPTKDAVIGCTKATDWAKVDEMVEVQ